MAPSESRLHTQFARIGTNYKLSNLLAVVGLCQMRRIEKLLSRRLALAERYLTLLGGHPKIGLPQTTPQGKHSRQSFCIYVDGRDEVMRELRQIGIEVQIGTHALHLHPPFAPSKHCRLTGTMEHSRYAFDHCLVLPLYHDLTAEDQETVVRELTRRL
jgi:dTDP-4-amino-4,6-dideoxygalactose transaminase